MSEKKTLQQPVVALVVAAGRSRRMAVTGDQAGVNKLLIEVAHQPMLVWTLSVFEQHAAVQRVYLTAGEDDVSRYQELIRRYHLGKVAAIVLGGDERQASVRRGLQYMAEHDAARDPLVAVHDGARPLLTQDKLSAVLSAALVADGAILAVPSKDTAKQVDDAGKIVQTVPRETLMMAQTPQVFSLRRLLGAHEAAYREGFRGTDDASLVEHDGGTVGVVLGDYDNIKITTPEDLIMFGAFMENQRTRQVDHGGGNVGHSCQNH